MSPRPPPIAIAVFLALGPAVSNGIGRFAYALILPAMRDDLAWSYAQAGWVNTANALGYLVGAILVMRGVQRIGPRLFFDGGMVVTCLTLVASGLLRDYHALLVCRGLTGVSGAFAFIGGGALVARLYADFPARAPSSITIYFAGGGAGILVSGALLPWLFAWRGAHAWDEAWIVLGVISFVLTVPSLWASSRVPAAPSGRGTAAWDRRPLLASLAGYFLFAVGAIIYMTFIIAWVRERGASPAAVSLVWGVLGIATLLSPVVWRRAMERWRGGGPLAASIAACAVGAALPLATRSLAGMLASAVIFGGSFFIPPAAVTALARRALPPASWGAAIAGYTVVFGIGQPIGPYLAGEVADVTGSLFAGLLTAVAVLAAAAAVSALQPAVETA